MAHKTIALTTELREPMTSETQINGSVGCGLFRIGWSIVHLAHQDWPFESSISREPARCTVFHQHQILCGGVNPRHVVLTATVVTAEVRGLMTSVTKSDDVGEISVYNAQPYYNVGISDLGGRPFTLHIEFAS